jgi:predicted TIM-barrel fold metal-dependent hydrolase
MAAICTLNPEDDSSPALVEDLMKRYGIRGVRSLPASDGRIDHPGVRSLWRGCADNNITVNVFIKYDKAQELSHLLEEFTEVSCVIDHCLIPGSGQAREKALAAMLRLAQYPNTFAKVTFLPLASTDQYPYLDLHEACRKIIKAYTPSRCVWGSNFPCELWSPRSTYRQNLDLFTSVLGLGTEAQADIFWNTPSRLWFDGS